MRILYLAHRIPYPPNKGDKIRSYHHLRHLAENHEVELLAFVDDPVDFEWADTLRGLCAKVVLLELKKSIALLRGSLSLAGGSSLTEGYFSSPQMWKAVREVASRRQVDVAWAFSSSMAQYLTAVDAKQKVVDVVDVDSEKWSQFAVASPPPQSWLYRLEAWRLRKLEARLGRVANAALFVSAEEAEFFRSFATTAIRDVAVPNGVDLEYFAAGEIDERYPGRLLFTGALDYRPNVDAVLRFSREVLPLIQREVAGAHLVAVGHRPANELEEESRRRPESLQIAGSVPDIRPYFRAASVYVAPMELGRGVQNKVLEAMAMKVPVVASPLATEGLEIMGGREVLIAPDAKSFAARVVDLLRGPELGESLASAAYSRVLGTYDWSANLSRLDQCLLPMRSIGAEMGPGITASELF